MIEKKIADIHIRIEPSLKEELEKIAKELNVKVSDFVRLAIEEGVEQMENEEMRDYLKAKLLDEEPDQAKIKWPKIKKWKLPRGKTVAKPHPPRRPPANEYRKILEAEGRNLKRCERCGSSTKSRYHIHHVDGNPWNNDPKNLRVLCYKCHIMIHGIEDDGIIDEKMLIPLDDLE